MTTLPIVEEGPECRICLDGGGNLIEPCACLGTSRYVHASCLNRWRAQFPDTHDNFRSCEICNSDYTIDFSPIISPQHLVTVFFLGFENALCMVFSSVCLIMEFSMSIDPIVDYAVTVNAFMVSVIVYIMLDAEFHVHLTNFFLLLIFYYCLAAYSYRFVFATCVSMNNLFMICSVVHPNNNLRRRIETS